MANGSSGAFRHQGTVLAPTNAPLGGESAIAGSIEIPLRVRQGDEGSSDGRLFELHLSSEFPYILGRPDTGWGAGEGRHLNLYQ